MGTISKRTSRKGTVTYQVKIRLKGVPNVSCTFPSRESAEDWLASTEPELIARSRKAATEQCHAKLVAEFRERPRLVADLLHRYLCEETVNKKGAEAEAHHIRCILKYPLARVHLENLTRRHVNEWRDRRLTDVAPSTVNRELNILIAVFRFACHEWGVPLDERVLVSVRRPKNPPPRERRLSPDEEKSLLAACSESRGGYLRDIVELAMETGMRQSELVGLDWQNVDLNRRTVRLLTSKNGNGRGVPLSSRAIEILKARAPEDRRTGRVFTGVTGEALKRAFIRAVERSGVQDFHFHDLRHEATSRFFEKGLNIMEAASITGHKDLRMLKRYTHLDASKLASRLD